MKPNTQKLSVPCDHVGTLSLVGYSGQTATFVATDLQVLEPSMLQKHMENADMKVIVVTDSVNKYRETTVIFQRDFVGKLRNPKGLLKFVRNALHKAMNKAEQEMWNQLESSPEDEEWSDSLFDDKPDEDVEDEEDNAADYRAQQEFAQQLPSFIAKGDTRFFS
jgi:hypothetical protein